MHARARHAYASHSKKVCKTLDEPSRAQIFAQPPLFGRQRCFVVVCFRFGSSFEITLAFAPASGGDHHDVVRVAARGGKAEELLEVAADGAVACELF